PHSHRHSFPPRRSSDLLIAELDHGLRVLAARTKATVEPSPAAGIAEAELAPAERSAAAGLMRVNHSGEVCAQALYRGQALGSGKDRKSTRLNSSHVKIS